MQLRNSFTVPVPVDEAWRVLFDIERVARCMPGARVEGFDGETIEGAVDVKAGPVTVTYRGTATFQEKNESAHRFVLAARGKEAPGQGTATATVTGTLAESDGGTAVAVVTDLTITGRQAQFGRGVMTEVGDKLIGQFADCLSRRLAGAGKSAVARLDGAEPAVVAGAGTHEAEPIDLLRTAGAPVAIRAAGAFVAAALAAALTVVLVRRARLIRRERRPASRWSSYRRRIRAYSSRA